LVLNQTHKEREGAEEGKIGRGIGRRNKQDNGRSDRDFWEK
jgi:hypothetical protein